MKGVSVKGEIFKEGFFKLTGASIVSTALLRFGFDVSAIAEEVEELRIKGAKEAPTICPYCSCGCGQIVHVEGGKVINIEGDPDHPVNEGARCSKGAALLQLGPDNERRLDRVLYRAPGSADWEEKSWDWAIEEIAKRVKETRDKNWIATETIDGVDYTVNRTDAIGAFGGAPLDTEEVYAHVKLMRALGVCFLEHQARL